MLGQRLRRWPNIEPTLGERLVIAGKCHNTHWGKSFYCTPPEVPLRHSVSTFYRPYWMTETFIIAPGDGGLQKQLFPSYGYHWLDMKPKHSERQTLVQRMFNAGPQTMSHH